ncbi:DUF721 domain-containing protein [Mycoavidus sp. B2-EB]|uniref:DUF721 domain-containing protein n=1 Tax=Mycoavidus sp. B2-EB TaxID=2651972 RepID=UPI0016279A41|nr:DUF721 domain-containing protein [Mycoavidus sp. B2-EB]BBO59094.1 hypothetical protein MPB2EB_0195 [Mycoavidus sp. B2-EB]
MSSQNFTKSSRPPNASSVVKLLERNETFAQLRAGIKQIAALEHDLASVLPDYLAPNISVGPIKNGTLSLLTAHNALAARLRHLEPRLLQTLQERGWLVDAIKIRVQSPHTKPIFTAKEAHLSKTGLTCLQDLHQKISPSPLQTAIAQMIERQTKISQEKI